MAIKMRAARDQLTTMRVLGALRRSFGASGTDQTPTTGRQICDTFPDEPPSRLTPLLGDLQTHLQPNPPGAELSLSPSVSPDLRREIKTTFAHQLPQGTRAWRGLDPALRAPLQPNRGETEPRCHRGSRPRAADKKSITMARLWPNARSSRTSPTTMGLQGCERPEERSCVDSDEGGAPTTDVPSTIWQSAAGSAPERPGTSHARSGAESINPDLCGGCPGNRRCIGFEIGNPWTTCKRNGVAFRLGFGPIFAAGRTDTERRGREKSAVASESAPKPARPSADTASQPPAASSEPSAPPSRHRARAVLGQARQVLDVPRDGVRPRGPACVPTASPPFFNRAPSPSASAAHVVAARLATPRRWHGRHSTQP